ncbi:MAG: hypothetical protein K0Q81_1381 [Paenibacillus sp.]|nr:hypothetical protein [Paenibacillus sp.]
MVFRNLLIKELKSILPVYGVFAVLVVLTHLIVLYKSPVLEDDGMFVLSVFLPYLFAAVIAIGTGYYQLHTEWKTNSIYLLLSLPVRGWKVITAKLAAVLLLLTVTLIWIGASFVLILLRVLWDGFIELENLPTILPAMLNVVFNIFWMSLLTVTLMHVLIQFTFLCGQLVAKFKWLVMFGAFVGMSWLIVRISPPLSKLLLWTPEILVGGTDLDVEYLHAGPFIVLLLLCIGLVALDGWIYEKEVEV